MVRPGTAPSLYIASLDPLSRKEENQLQGCPKNLRQAYQTPYLGSAGRETYDYSGGLMLRALRLKHVHRVGIFGRTSLVGGGTVGTVLPKMFGFSAVEAGHGFAFLTNSALMFKAPG